MIEFLEPSNEIALFRNYVWEKKEWLSAFVLRNIDEMLSHSIDFSRYEPI